ncbi:hypothetical protein COY06_05495 [Candidatus Peregrinibacteria bacterium CG_4_10_14_0_2_um_filter_41_8]|nr:MAG: hypothetical protein COY06_05495 [Candidatus Peregrinibacteria bacterium CG_4_10_14_0_2_um_filter_41_8]
MPKLPKQLEFSKDITSKTPKLLPPNEHTKATIIATIIATMITTTLIDRACNNGYPPTKNAQLTQTKDGQIFLEYNNKKQVCIKRPSTSNDTLNTLNNFAYIYLNENGNLTHMEIIPPHNKVPLKPNQIILLMNEKGNFSCLMPTKRTPPSKNAPPFNSRLSIPV